MFILLWSLLVVELCPCWPPSSGLEPVKYKQNNECIKQVPALFLLSGWLIIKHEQDQRYHVVNIRSASDKQHKFIRSDAKIMFGCVWQYNEVRCVVKRGSLPQPCVYHAIVLLCSLSDISFNNLLNVKYNISGFVQSPGECLI